MEEMILILDFGSQYTQLIARRLRELNVYCEIHPYTNIPAIEDNMIGVILSGSPFSVRSEDAPNPDLSQFRNKLPLLGVCYGAQFLAQKNGGSVMPSETREYGRANLAYINQDCELVKGMTDGSQVWMSHGDTIKELPSKFEIISSTNDVEVAGYQVKGERTYGIQFHPEVDRKSVV
jgi:GMP synthase (glutamine-hydrolysing)